MTKNKALELAIKQFYAFDFVMKRSESTEKAIAAIKEALAIQQVLPDAITDNSESPDYISGWNECREVMAGMMK